MKNSLRKVGKCSSIGIYSGINFNFTRYFRNLMFKKKFIYTHPKKFFRDWTKHPFEFPDNRYYGGKTPSPYQPQFTLTPEEEEANKQLPVQERVLDFKKYMHHKGELKYSTGAFMVDVEPFPRLKIMMLCHVIMQLLKEFDSKFLYRHIMFEHIKFIMEIVDQNEVLVNIENALVRFENMENLIIKLDDEVTLLRFFLHDNHYKLMMNTSNESPYPEMFFNSGVFDIVTHEKGENVSHRKHEKPERPKTIIDDIFETRK